eukprot:6201019-Pleurochrysis_carterae.AAC.1
MQTRARSHMLRRTDAIKPLPAHGCERVLFCQTGKQAGVRANDAMAAHSQLDCAGERDSRFQELSLLYNTQSRGN